MFSRKRGLRERIPHQKKKKDTSLFKKLIKFKLSLSLSLSLTIFLLVKYDSHSSKEGKLRVVGSGQECGYFCPNSVSCGKLNR
jgi:hypothetical protein